MRKKTENWLRKYTIYLLYLQVWAGLLGSLYFSEIMNLPPCVLCVIQRMLLYPLVLIFSVGIWRKDEDLPWYVLPFSIFGIIVAAYHNLIYYHVIPEFLTPCSIQLPCTEDFSLFGFISIPLMSLVSFIVVTVGIVIHDKLKLYREC